MSPCVRTDLVTISIHALDVGGKFRGDINFALANVVTSDEKGSLGVVGLEEVQDMGGVVL